ncbi:hypothetical protein OIU76_024809, partial [Salix suchowensis]
MASRVTTVKNAEKLVERTMKGNDASHDAAHVWRVRDLALSLAQEEGLSSDSMEIVKPFKLNRSLTLSLLLDFFLDLFYFRLGVELAALLHDIGDYKYLRDPSEEKIVQNFLEEEGVDEIKKMKILTVINGM